MATESTIESVKFGRANVIVEAESKHQAAQMVRHCLPWSYQFNQEILIFYPGCKQPYRIPSPTSTYREFQPMTTITMPKLFMGKIGIYTPEFLGSIQKMMERSGDRLGLIRVRDNRQLVMSMGNSNHLKSEDLSQNVTLTRDQYWNLEDLEEFNRLCQQQLREDGSNTLEFSYRALTNRVNSLTDWSKFTSRYRLILDGQEAYQQFEILNISPIQSLTNPQ